MYLSDHTKPSFQPSNTKIWCGKKELRLFFRPLAMSIKVVSGPRIQVVWDTNNEYMEVWLTKQNKEASKVSVLVKICFPW